MVKKRKEHREHVKTMKTIGRSCNNGYIVEMTLSEYRELSKLADAVEGRSVDHLMDYNLSRVDYSGVFGCIRGYAMANFRLNELQKLLDSMKDLLNHKEVAEESIISAV